MAACPIPLSEFEASVGEHAVSLPPACFTSQEFYEFELDAVWGHDWFCVGRASDVPNPGDFVPVTVGPDPLMIVRGDDGAVRVLSAVCRHRGFVLVDEPGNVNRFRCPYHAWTYGLDGRLQSAPLLNDDPTFDKSCVRLPEVRSEVWEGFVFACFDADVPPIGERLANLSEQLANYRLGELRAPTPLELVPYEWNWKLYADECYHCSHLHPTTWMKLFPSPPKQIETESEYNDPENGILAYNLKATCIDASPNRTRTVLHPVLPDLTDEERMRLAYITIAPNLLMIPQPDKVKYYVWLPTGPASSTFGVSWLFPESTHADAGFPDRLKEEQDDLMVVMQEDVWAWTQVQRGLRSRFASRGRFSPKESIPIQLNEWLVSKYMAASAALA
jgi:phenylpropionate dioxygenase-like ring-hydroxylating dioxygenase large terminal subunit